MKRFMGMMPSDEIEKVATYIDRYDKRVRVEAGPNGWTVTYADGGTNYKDIKNPTAANFAEALLVAKDTVGPLKETVDTDASEACGEC